MDKWKKQIIRNVQLPGRDMNPLIKIPHYDINNKNLYWLDPNVVGYLKDNEQSSFFDRRPLSNNLSDNYPIPIIYVKVNNPKFLVVICHSNTQDIGMLDEYIQFFNNLQISNLVFEYPGYGLSDGERSVPNVNNHAYLIILFIKNNLQIPISRVILLGISIGTGVAIEMNSRLYDMGEIPAAIILKSPFTSTLDILNNKGFIANTIGLKGFSSLLIDYIIQNNKYDEIYDNIGKVNKIYCPLFIFHGENDQIINVDQSKILFTYSINSPNKKIIIDPIGHHGDLNMNQFFYEVKQFIETL